MGLTLDLDLKKCTSCGACAIACMHCPDAPCVAACPSACIAKDPETNLTIFDNTNCIGCHSCAMACPFGIPSFNEEGKMQKCDGCAVRIQNGLEPACVRACPAGALGGTAGRRLCGGAPAAALLGTAAGALLGAARGLLPGGAAGRLLLAGAAGVGPAVAVVLLREPAAGGLLVSPGPAGAGGGVIVHGGSLFSLLWRGCRGGPSARRSGAGAGKVPYPLL